MASSSGKWKNEMNNCVYTKPPPPQTICRDVFLCYFSTLARRLRFSLSSDIFNLISSPICIKIFPNRPPRARHTPSAQQKEENAPRGRRRGRRRMDRGVGGVADEAKKQTLKRKASNNFHINRPENGNKGISLRSAIRHGTATLSDFASVSPVLLLLLVRSLFLRSLRRRSFSPLHNIRIGDS